MKYTPLLGVLIAIGPLGIDLYLPAFPAIAAALHTNIANVQLSLAGYFGALAIGQLVYGPLSDRYGRKKPLLVGMIIYALAALAASKAPTIQWLIGWRIVQGLGGCSGTVIARSIVRDLAAGPDAAKLYSRMLLIFGVTPILAPTLGSLFLLRFHWESLFWFMALCALLAVAVTHTFLPETAPRLALTHPQKNILAKYSGVLGNRQFVLLAGITGLLQAAFFAYIAGSPNDFLLFHHLSAGTYGLLFGCNAIGLISASQFNGWLLRKFGAARILRQGTLISASSMAILLGATMFHFDSVSLSMVCLFVSISCQGCLIPNTMMLAMEPFSREAGVASAVLGTSMYASGALAGAAVSFFFNGTAIPMVAVMSLCTAGAFSLTILVRRFFLAPMPGQS